MTHACRNHYVPVWYQKRFLLPGESKYHYLDLSPDVVTSPGGRQYKRRELLHWGPNSCFFEKDLYTTKFGSQFNDEIETQFFRPIDDRGKKAVEAYADFVMGNSVIKAFHDFMHFMNAQRMRTPQSLDWLRSAASSLDYNEVLTLMQRMFQAHGTMWMEGVWEIVGAHQCETKFIVTDQPVTFYNHRAFPNSRLCRYPHDVSGGYVGTRTIFPLGLESCLIITHRQFIRDPWSNPLRARVNARTYDETAMNVSWIQYGRELTEDEVARINLILKRRASRYIAAANKRWLYPEERVGTHHWSKLDEDWFLFPHLYKVPFTGGIFFGGGRGPGLAMDEYGRRPGQPGYQDEARRDREWRSHQKAKVEWARRREGRSMARICDFREDGIDDQIMARNLEQARRRRT